MSRPKPKCFCRPQVEDCPTCTKVNWANVRPSNGDAHKERIVAARFEPRKLAIAASLIMQVIVWTGPRPTPEQAAETLRRSPGLSNRTGLSGLPAIVPVGPLWLRPPTPPAPAKTSPAPAARESEQGRANRMGIPGGWSPLEWAILHSGK